MDAPIDLLADLRAHYDLMPPVRTLGLVVDGFDAGVLALSAPLGPNINDKGCAFGGSLASLLTLAGWGRVWLGLRSEGLDADIYVADSQIRYLAPLYGDLRAQARLPDGADWPQCLAALRQRGRGRIDLEARIDLPDGRPAATFTGRYAAIAKAAAG